MEWSKWTDIMVIEDKHVIVIKLIHQAQFMAQQVQQVQRDQQVHLVQQAHKEFKAFKEYKAQ